jgi:Lrp/AsnC family transcriptional regulator for asnA, asnC and gidA
MAESTQTSGRRAGGRGRTKRAVGNGGAAEAAPESGARLELDRVDRTIITMLQEDGRTAFTSIADVLKVSEGTIRNRVARLLDSKVLRIIGVADPLALGYHAYAMIGLKLAPGGDPDEAAARFNERPETTYVASVAGRFDLLVEVICQDQDELRAFLRRHCYGRRDIASVEPMIGLAMYKNKLKWG